MNKKLKTTLLAWPLITIATIAVCWMTGLVAELLHCEMPAQPSLSAVLNSRGWTLVKNIASILVAAPVLEEFLFRWVLWRLPTRFLGVRADLPAAIASSVLFSAAHYVQETTPFPDTAFVALFLFGFLQCRLYRKTESIWCPMLQHSLFNLANLVLIFAFPKLATA